MVNNTNPYEDFLKNKGVDYGAVVGGHKFEGPIWDRDNFLQMMIYFADCTERMQELTDEELLEFENPPPVLFVSEANASEPFKRMCLEGLQLRATFQEIKDANRNGYRKSMWCSPDKASVSSGICPLLPCDDYEISGIFKHSERDSKFNVPVYIKFALSLTVECYLFVSFHDSTV